MTGHSISAFYQVPEELLTDIVEELILADERHNGQILRDLRLVHPRFAHLERVKRVLFDTVRLSPEPRRLARIDSFENVAPYVRQAVFEPVTFRTSSGQALSSSVSKARQEYESELSRLLKSGQAREKLTAVVRLMLNLQRVTITEPKSPGEQEVSMPVGDDLWELALGCLNAVKVAPSELVLQHRPHLMFSWGTYPTWVNLDMSRMKLLHFHATSDTREEIAWQWIPDPFSPGPPPIVTGMEPVRTVSDMLVRSASTLEELSCSCPALVFGLCWQKLHSPAMPLLRNFHLSDCLVDGDTFGHWLGKCTSLELITMTRMGPRLGETSMHWQPMFDAIREHPNRLKVVFDEVDLFAGVRWRLSLDHDTSGSADPTTGCYPPKLCAHLKNYMSSLRDWISEAEEREDLE